MPQNIIFDIESYPNYFLIVMKLQGAFAPLIFESRSSDKPLKEDYITMIKALLRDENTTLIGFNSLSYDVPMLLRALSGGTTEELHVFSDRIINNRFVDKGTHEAVSQFGKMVNHVDVMKSILGFASLKLCAARLHCKDVEELPYNPAIRLSQEQMDHVQEYCINDCVNTEALYEYGTPIRETRETLERVYDVDCVNLTNSSICEKIVLKETGMKPQRGENDDFDMQFTYKAPNNLHFNNRFLQDHLDKYQSLFKVKTDTKKQEIVAQANYFKQESIMFAGVEWNIGIGGIHTNDSKGRIDARDGSIRILNLDVGAYYPTLIMNHKLGPRNRVKRASFLQAFQRIYQRRMEAKAKGDKDVSNALKIPLNSVSGKFNSKYSVVYSPESYIHMTLTGQLLIMKLAEMMYEAGARIYSANTDSLIVTCKPNQVDELRRVANLWEIEFRCSLDFEDFLAVYSRDVNNYFALKSSDDPFHDHVDAAKGKGAFSTVGGDGHWPNNPRARVCYEAVISKAAYGTPLDDHIRNEKDITKFIFVGSATKGAKYEEQRLGKVFRFIWITNGHPLYRDSEEEHRIPESDSCVPLMYIPYDKGDIEDASMLYQIWGLLDYERYIARAEKIWDDCGGNL